MGLFDRLRRSSKTSSGPDAAETLRAFVESRTGVEAWAELPTSFNPPSVLLVAHDGEWVRLAVPSIDWLRKWCGKNQLPCHQAGIISYPQRMRDYNARQRGRRLT